MSKLIIRQMELADIPGVMNVDKLSFPSPWTKEIYEQEVDKNDFAYYFVIETASKIVGYVGIWLIFEEAQITNIAVHPQYRGRSIGEMLFAYAISFSLRNGAEKLSLEVRPSNTVAQKMYKKFGLKPGGIRKNYYPDNGEDAIVMWVNLAEVNVAAFQNEK